METALAAIWGELLGGDQIGRDDHFFELGGHSLMAIQLVGRIREQFKVDVPLGDIFEHPVLHALA
ncbi:phosphopantetheine-binding protein [Massilia sp. H-1]|nr:phosphopantetheine-binding protein [Massilia sp. H-1]